MESNRGEITILLARISAGDKSAEISLIDRVYAELHHIAMKRLRMERRDHTLQPTALVNEAYLRLCRTDGLTFYDRAHFFGIAVTIMRRVLVDYARKRGAKRRGDHGLVISIDDVAVAGPDWYAQAVEVNDLLNVLAKCLPRPAQVAEMRYFAGLTNEEIAASLGCTTRTVCRDWMVARAWLRDRITSASSKPAD